MVLNKARARVEDRQGDTNKTGDMRGHPLKLRGQFAEGTITEEGTVKKKDPTGIEMWPSLPQSAA